MEPGILTAQGQVMIDAPTTTSVNASFIVTVTTWGGNCVSADTTATAPSSDGFDITPYDRRLIPEPGAACPANLRPILHSVSLTFDVVGMKVLHVHGRDAQEQMIEVPVPIRVE